MPYEYDPDTRYYLPPIGRYQFTVRSEPDSRRPASGKGKYYVLKFWIADDFGDRHKFSDIMVPWKDEWRDLLLALGGHEDPDTKKIVLDEEEWVGKTFTAEIRHDPDAKRSGQMRGRICNIHVPERQLKMTEEDEQALGQEFDKEGRPVSESGSDDIPEPTGKPEDDGEIPF